MARCRADLQIQNNFLIEEKTANYSELLGHFHGDGGHLKLKVEDDSKENVRKDIVLTTTMIYDTSVPDDVGEEKIKVKKIKPDPSEDSNRNSVIFVKEENSNSNSSSSSSPPVPIVSLDAKLEVIALHQLSIYKCKSVGSGVSGGLYRGLINSISVILGMKPTRDEHCPVTGRYNDLSSRGRPEDEVAAIVEEAYQKVTRLDLFLFRSLEKIEIIKGHYLSVYKNYGNYTPVYGVSDLSWLYAVIMNCFSVILNTKQSEEAFDGYNQLKSRGFPEEGMAVLIEEAYQKALKYKNLEKVESEKFRNYFSKVK